MAKWGEGDPRWIVEERPDATNVNNWHWTEKNATPWSKERIRSLFNNFVVKQGDIECVVSGVDKIEGEATANNRKGKLIFFYEWNVVLKWSGRLPGQQDAIEGKVTIPNLSEENSLDEIDISITIDTSNEYSDKLKQFMYSVGRGIIRAQIGVYLKELREEFSRGLILPKKDDVAKKPVIKQDGVSNITSGFNQKITMDPVNSSPTEKPLGVKLSVTTLKFTETFQCQVADLYQVLLKPEMVSAFTRGPCKVDPIKGGIFELFGGNINGKFEELIPNQKITQTWRYKQWPEGHFSKVVIEFVEKEDHTEINVTQSGVPNVEKETTMRNWKNYYWNSIRQTFGFGSFLM